MAFVLGINAVVRYYIPSHFWVENDHLRKVDAVQIQEYFKAVYDDEFVSFNVFLGESCNSATSTFKCPDRNFRWYTGSHQWKAGRKGRLLKRTPC